MTSELVFKSGHKSGQIGSLFCDFRAVNSVKGGTHGRLGVAMGGVIGLVWRGHTERDKAFFSGHFFPFFLLNKSRPPTACFKCRPIVCLNNELATGQPEIFLSLKIIPKGGGGCPTELMVEPKP